MKLIINGALGRTGSEVYRLLREGAGGHTLAAAVDRDGEGEVYRSLADFTGEADGLIDFSHHSATAELLRYACERKLPVVLATTGHSPEESELIRQAAQQIPIFRSANMSVGVAVLVQMARQAAHLFPDADIEIVETHHNRKLDAPSGTALMIADEIRKERKDAVFVFGRGGQHKREKNEIGIHAVRLGNTVGTHEVLIGTDSQTFVLRHEAHSRALFAEGALSAASFLAGRGPGLYDMHDLLSD